MAAPTDRRDPSFTLPVQYLRHIADQIRAQGGDPRHWLALSRLTEAHLDDPALAVPYAVFHQLVRDSLTVAREPALGLFVGERLVASTHGILGYAALQSGTLRQALEVLERYTRVRTTLVSVSSEAHRGELRVRFAENHPLGEIRRPVLEAILLSIKNLVDTIARGTCTVRRASFTFEAPDYAPLARELFQCDVRYAQPWAGLVVPLDGLDAPLRLADPTAYQDALAICQRELDKLTGSETLATRIRRMLLEKQNGFPSLAVTARVLHMTPRTLHRRLVAEGTSYKQLLESVRHMLAVEHLKSGLLTIEQLAYTLGYSDLANFRRAFKRWERVPPAAYRRRLAARARRAGPARPLRRAPGR